ncbi:hypothetical protein Tco_0464411 [Tanacetum coccineum]
MRTRRSGRKSPLAYDSEVERSARLRRKAVRQFSTNLDFAGLEELLTEMLDDDASGWVGRCRAWAAIALEGIVFMWDSDMRDAIELFLCPVEFGQSSDFSFTERSGSTSSTYDRRRRKISLFCTKPSNIVPRSVAMVDSRITDAGYILEVSLCRNNQGRESSEGSGSEVL